MPGDYVFRVRYAMAGGHVHCRLFSQRNGSSTWQLLGTFVSSDGHEFMALVDQIGPDVFVSDKTSPETDPL